MPASPATKPTSQVVRNGRRVDGRAARGRAPAPLLDLHPANAGAQVGALSARPKTP